MKLDFYEADMLAFFLRQTKEDFVECAMDFGWELQDAQQFHEDLLKKTLKNLFKELE
jgi:hypothetical protein